MPSSDSELLKSLVNERLKFVDSLVKNNKLDEAAKEIAEIRKVDPKNPYALAYEERIVTLQGTIVLKEEAKIVAPPHPPAPAPQPLKPVPEQTTPKLHVTVSPSAPAVAASQVKESAGRGPGLYKAGTKDKSTVVLVDDDVLLVQALAELLEDNKYTAKTFNKSDEAFEYLKTESPDIIICDVNLETSSFGGFTLHEKIRKLEHLRDVPFLFLSGLTDTAIVLAGKQLGADDYLTKPVEPEALLAVVKGKLKRYRQIKKNS